MTTDVSLELPFGSLFDSIHADTVVKVRVKCNQTGKVFVCPLSRLEDQQGSPILLNDLDEGASVYWSDDDGERGFPVKVLRVLGSSKHNVVIVCRLILVLHELYREAALLCMPHMVRTTMHAFALPGG